jgi:hypothetical protein
MRPAHGIDSQEVLFLKSDEIGKQRASHATALSRQSPVVSAFRVSEG